MALSLGTRRGDATLDDSFVAPPLAGLVIYQLTIDPTMAPERRAETLDSIAALGVTAIELLPTSGHRGARALRTGARRGGARLRWRGRLRELIAEAHHRGLAVIVNIAYQRADPSRRGAGHHAGLRTCRVIVREALRWLRDTHVDGVRHDMDAYTGLVEARRRSLASVGWQLIREMNAAIREEHSNIVLIALDDRGDARVTSMDASGALFHTQWDMQFVHAIRESLDGRRPMADVRDAIGSSFGDTYSRTSMHTAPSSSVASPPRTRKPWTGSRPSG
jgi:1,4-alpha-glucan branching enzyme